MAIARAPRVRPLLQTCRTQRQPALRVGDDPRTHAVPVTVDGSPPAVARARAVVRHHTVAETEVDDGPPDSVALRLRPGVEHPVVRDRERRRELSDVEEVASVPVVGSSSERLSRRVARGDLRDPTSISSLSLLEAMKDARRAPATHDRPTWCRSTSSRRIPSASSSAAPRGQHRGLRFPRVRRPSRTSSGASRRT